MSNQQTVNMETGKVEVEVYTKTEAALSILREEFSVIPDCESKEGYKAAASGIKKISKYRTALEKERKRIKQPHLNAGKIIDTEAKRITAELTAIEEPLKEAKRLVDEREEQARKERILRLQKKIDDIKDNVRLAHGRESVFIAALIEKVDSIDTANDFYDLTHEATIAQADTLERLNNIYTDRINQEQAEVERKKAEEESERLRVELALLQAEKAKAEAEALTKANQEAVTTADPVVEQAPRFVMPVRGAKEEQQAMPFDTPEMVAADIGGASAEMITITRDEYDALLADRDMLDALKAAGVDNWAGYSEAIEMIEAA